MLRVTSPYAPLHVDNASGRNAYVALRDSGGSRNANTSMHQDVACVTRTDVYNLQVCLTI